MRKKTGKRAAEKVSPTAGQTAAAPSCDWKQPVCIPVEDNGDALYRHKGNGRWSGVRTEKYKQENGGWSSIVRTVLVGNRGESAKFHLRYFEIAPGGFSSLEKHRHEHVVVCIRGKGKVRMGNRSYAIKHLDTVYIAPDSAHQLSNPYDEPFGFFCIVNAKRDKPKKIEKEK